MSIATRDSIINEAYKLKNALFEAEKAKNLQYRVEAKND